MNDTPLQENVKTEPLSVENGLPKIVVHDAPLLVEPAGNTLLLDQLGIDPIGIRNGKPVVYFRTTREVLTVGAGRDSLALLGRGVLMSLATRTIAKTGETLPDFDRAFDRILIACQKIGAYSDDDMRGAGIWADQNGNAILSDGSRFFRHENVSYMPSASGFIQPEPAEREDLADDCRLLMRELTTRFNAHAAVTILGFIAAALAAGALPWRPHAWLSGARGSGKSFAKDVIEIILGKAAMSMDSGTSAAGVRQKLNSSAKAVLIDESEATESEGLSALLAIARSAAGRDVSVKGGADGNARTYGLTSCFCFASISTATDGVADESRIVPVELTGSSYFSPLLADKIWLSRLGRMIAHCIVQDLPGLLESVRNASAAEAAKGDFRRGQTLGAILGCARWIAKDETLTLDERVVKARFESSDEDTWMNRIVAIMTPSCDAETGDFGPLCTLGKQLSDGEMKLNAQMFGIAHRRSDDTLFVANRSAALLKHLNCRRDGAWRNSLERIPGAKSDVNSRINGRVVRGTTIPLSFVMDQQERESAEVKAVAAIEAAKVVRHDPVAFKAELEEKYGKPKIVETAEPEPVIHSGINARIRETISANAAA